MKSASVFADVRAEEEFDEASQSVRNFFPNAYEKKREYNGIVLTYRAKQSVFARQIMDAIRNNQILIVQAGVGIGKTFGYLIPVFYTYQNVKKMKHFVISTSNIGLQQQLLTDINKVSNMLDIPLNAVIAKGINNYACVNRIQNVLSNSSYSERDRDVIREMLDEIAKKKTVDKDELKQIGDEVWDLIKLKNRGVCSKCSYSKNCLYLKSVKAINTADIVVTNHNMLVKSLLEGRSFIQQADAFIFDEAHRLEDAIRDIQGGTLDIDIIRKTLKYFVENIVMDTFQQDYILQTIKEIESFFYCIKRRGSGYYFNNIKENIVEITDCDKIPFSVEKLDDKIYIIIDRLHRIYTLIDSIHCKSDYRKEQLEQWIYIFNDMIKKRNSENIYWADFFKKDAIRIGYTNKKSSYITSKLVAKNIPIVFTSGTLMDSNNSYDYFKESLSLTGFSTPGHPIYDGQVCASPYDYDKKSLFYYDKNITNPNVDHQKYLDELVVKIKELLTITHGRTLVLFTSKSDMNYVYEKLNKEELPFNILMQGMEQSNYKIYSDFEKNSETCLFSTGAWEGLDVKGKSLSSVIITRLPFATDNAIMQYRQQNHDYVIFNINEKHNKKESDNSIYLNDMLQKLAQGTGRLIRGKNDTGIICCLDSRFLSYKDYIMKVLPFTNYTDDLAKAIEFSEKNITNRDGPRGPYKKR